VTWSGCPWCAVGDLCPRHPRTGNEVHPDTPRIDWLGEDWSRLEDVRGLLNNDGAQSIREAIDRLRGAR
jgi:hypothetical protein